MKKLNLSEKSWLYLVTVVSIVILALFLRINAANNLSSDYDEPHYISVADSHRFSIMQGNFIEVLRFGQNLEHPALSKLVYALSYIVFSPYDYSEMLIVGRYVSILFGIISILVISLLNPIAGLFLAVDSFHVRFTSEVMLESLPFLTSILSILFLSKSSKYFDNWEIASAILFGITLAGKYTFGIVLFPILYIYLFQKKRKILQLILFGLIALISMYIFNPYLWENPAKNLIYSIKFHMAYSHGYDVINANLPWYQPINYLIHPFTEKVFLFRIDALILFFAVIGIYREWKIRPWSVVWLVSGLFVLLLWSTKWPQYIMIILAPLCLNASSGLMQIWSWIIMIKNKIMK